MIPLDVDALLTQIRGKALYAGITGVTEVTPSVISSNHAGQEPLTTVTHTDPLPGNTGNTPEAGAPDAEAVTHVTRLPPTLGNTPIVGQDVDTAKVKVAVTPVTPVTQQKEHLPPLPPLYPGHPVGAPFLPGHQVWLYRWDDQTPRFTAPVTIVQMRTLWPGEQDIGWRDAAGALSWHNAQLAVAVETQEVLNQSQTAIQE
jgi:hypothetical protein